MMMFSYAFITDQARHIVSCRLSFVCQCYLHPLSFLADLFVLRPVLNFTLTSFCLTVLFASTTLSCRPACVEASAGFDTLGCSNAEYDTASI